MCLKHKLLLPNVLLIALTMTVVTITSYLKSSNALEEAITSKLELLTELVQKDIGLWAKAREADILVWSEDPFFVKALSSKDKDLLDQASQELVSLTRRYPMYETLLLADAHGAILAANSPKLSGKVRIGNRAYFKQAMSGQIARSEVLKSRATGNAIIVFAAPVNKAGQIIGVIVGAINIAYLADNYIDHVKPGGTGYLYAFDRRGMVVAYPKKEEILKLDVSKFDFGREMMSRKNGMVNYEFRGVKKKVAFRHIPQLDWTIASTSNVDELYAPARQLGRFNLLIAIFVVLAAGVLVWFLALSVVRSINKIMKNLSGGARQVAAASDQVSASSQTLAQGSGEQAASLEETASSMEEMSSMTRQNADNARLANSLMQEAGKVVAQANISMKELRGAMEKITSASDETAKIIKSIDEIAFQTNLLALNAAVEAARAGEAGAGFAVVADEVRSLAVRAAEAAKNTSDLIEGNLQNIKRGAGLVASTDQAFSQMEENSRKASELVAEIAAASGEQAQGIEQINKAAGEMDRVTQQVAANAEETAASSEELSAQAETLNEMVQELRAMVDGSRSNGTKRFKSGNGNEESMPSYLRAPREAHQDDGESADPKPKTVNTSARREIPLEDDEDFADF
jgi:methyl-accepting chemotaxis protein